MTCPFHMGDMDQMGADQKDMASQGDSEVLDYHSYLRLDSVLNSNFPQSKLAHMEVHTEHLFITIHQVFELWFKQVIHELRSVVGQFHSARLEDDNLLFIHNCLNRISGILTHLGSQFELLETMTPMEFLEFREFLGTASGFQSWQFRVFENLLGLKPEWRNRYGKKDYKNFLQPEHAQKVCASEHEENLLDGVCAWLTRCPFLFGDEWHFWEEYQKAILQKCERDMNAIHQNPNLSEEQRAEELEDLQKSHESTWRLVLDEDYYQEMRRKNRVRITYEAFQGALFINVYRNHPALQMPYHLLKDLMDIETSLRGFRTRHANMVQRMIGTKLGTGGSSGYEYLRTSAKKHCVFNDLFNLSSYFLPISLLPEMPSQMANALGSDLGRSTWPSSPLKSTSKEHGEDVNTFGLDSSQI